MCSSALALCHCSTDHIYASQTEREISIRTHFCITCLHTQTTTKTSTTTTANELNKAGCEAAAVVRTICTQHQHTRRMSALYAALPVTMTEDQKRIRRCTALCLMAGVCAALLRPRRCFAVVAMQHFALLVGKLILAARLARLQMWQFLMHSVCLYACGLQSDLRASTTTRQGVKHCS